MGMLGILCLLLVCVSVCVSAGYFVKDISGVGWRRAMKFCRMVDLGGYQVISPLNWTLDQGLAPAQKVKNFGNAYLVDHLRDRAEIL